MLESNPRRPSQLKTTHYVDENCMALEIWIFEKYDQWLFANLFFAPTYWWDLYMVQFPRACTLYDYLGSY
jgi:hypothetical protein